MRENHSSLSKRGGFAAALLLAAAAAVVVAGAVTFVYVARKSSPASPPRGSFHGPTTPPPVPVSQGNNGGANGTDFEGANDRPAGAENEYAFHIAPTAYQGPEWSRFSGEGFSFAVPLSREQVQVEQGEGYLRLYGNCSEKVPPDGGFGNCEYYVAAEVLPGPLRESAIPSYFQHEGGGVITKVRVNGRKFYIGRRSVYATELWETYTSWDEKVLNISFGGRAFVRSGGETITKEELDAIVPVLASISPSAM
ncbi:hypothetical protein D6779_10650 [Candidatus Parcubacteria bacterium]|nr:MAG: hypothetical protein D6779_10650 [Candidatus Parcubacteria bacterium]